MEYVVYNILASGAGFVTTRAFTDRSWADFSVRLPLRVRRFACSNTQCPRRTFAERLGEQKGEKKLGTFPIAYCLEGKNGRATTFSRFSLLA